MRFPFGVTVTLLPVAGGSVAVAGSAVAARVQLEPPVPSWPPLTSGRDWYAPAGTVVSRKDRAVYLGVTYQVDGDPEVWDSPFTGTSHGVLIHLRRTDDWYDTTVQIRTYLGSGGFGPTWATAVSWPANIVSTDSLNAGTTGDETKPAAVVRVPPTNASVQATAAFTIGSIVVIGAVEYTVTRVAPVTRDGVIEYVEVTA